MNSSKAGRTPRKGDYVYQCDKEATLKMISKLLDVDADVAFKVETSKPWFIGSAEYKLTVLKVKS